MTENGMNELEVGVSVQADDKPPEPIKVTTSSGGGLLEDPDSTDKPPEPIK